MQVGHGAVLVEVVAVEGLVVMLAVGGGSRGEKDKGIAEAVPIVRLIAPVWACAFECRSLQRPLWGWQELSVELAMIWAIMVVVSEVHFVSTPARSCAHLPSRCPSFLRKFLTPM